MNKDFNFERDPYRNQWAILYRDADDTKQRFEKILKAVGVSWIYVADFSFVLFVQFETAFQREMAVISVMLSMQEEEC